MGGIYTKNRKKLLALLVVFTLILGISNSVTVMAGDKTTLYVSTAGGDLNVRNAPGLSSRIIGSLANGTRLKDWSLESKYKDGYYWVAMTADDIYGNEIYGYVAEAYLSATRPYSILTVNPKLPNVG